MIVDPADYLQTLIYYLGTFEPYCLPFVRGCANAGGTIVDVGANIGFYTIESALVVGPAGRMISIEAAKPHVAALRHNIDLNALNNVSLIDIAVGDRTGKATLALPLEANLGSFTVGQVNSNETYHVEVRRLDDVLADLNVHSLDLIKMDIEGSEFRALSGAEETLKRFRPAILIELNEVALGRCGASSSQVKVLLGQAGYLGWIIKRDGVRPIPVDMVTHDCDECLFVHGDNTRLLHKLGLSKQQGGR